MKPRYSINIHFDGEQYVAAVPDLANCSGVGATYSEAAANAEEAIMQWVMKAISDGRYIPAPAPQQSAAKRGTPTLLGDPPSKTEAKAIIDQMMTDTYGFRKKYHRSQATFWQRFGIKQATASRYEREVGGQRRKLPFPLAMLTGLWILRRIDDRALAEVHALIRPHYQDQPSLVFDSSDIKTA